MTRGAAGNPRALVIGGGPAGLMAAEVLAGSGARVTLAEAKPSFGRKFLMAGKSGLNLTKNEPFSNLIEAYGAAAPVLTPALEDFDAQAVMRWAEGLGQTLFTGSTGRVFPDVMKASPLLRAWLARLDALGVERHTRWRWSGWDAGEAVFDTPDGPRRVKAEATVLALGGASWPRLGSDGEWAPMLATRGVPLQPFGAANAGILVDWSDHMAKVAGRPLKAVAFRAGKLVSRGEAAISATGLEGGGVYPLSPAIREGAELSVDLLPDLDTTAVAARLAHRRSGASLSNHLRRSLRLGPVRMALLNECARPLPQVAAALAGVIKNLPVPHRGLAPIEGAISTAGGVSLDGLTQGLMLRALPGVWCAGEMLDWEAPTGGYLLTGCLATGRHAASDAARRLGLAVTAP